MSDSRTSVDPGAGSGSERDLINRALEQARPRSGSASKWSDQPKPEVIGGYEIVREIHRGGQGVVYQAIQKATKRKIAVKVLHETALSGSAGRQRFEREVQILGQLNHPNIVKVLDSGVTEAGRYFYVMDYISGRALDEVISGSKDKPPRIGDVLTLFCKICDAVATAHLHGVIHRDLKPSNIRIDNSGEPVVVDFGLAKIAVPDVTEESRPQLMTMTGQFIGSLPWASPEQAEGQPDRIDVRTDVYSLGVILYQMLTGGKFPYEVLGNMRDVLDNILRAEPARPSTIRKQVDDEVETIVLKCLSKERERRYQSAGELGRDVRNYLRGEPIEAKRDSGWYVISKTLRRYRPHAAVAAVFLVLIVGGGIGFGMMSVRHATTRAEAKANFDAYHGALLTLLTLDDEAKDKLGFTQLRQVVTESALLEPLRESAGNDPERLRLRAKALDHYGDLLGGRSYGITGDVAGAEAAYEEARQIREGLLEEDETDRELQLALVGSLERLAWIAQQKQRYLEGLDTLAQAHILLDAVASAPLGRKGADDEIGARRAAIDVQMGELQFKYVDDGHRDEGATRGRAALERYSDALEYWTRRAELDPTDATAHESIVDLLLHMGSWEVNLARWMHVSAAKRLEDEDPAAALQQYQLALEGLSSASETGRQGLNTLLGASARLGDTVTHGRLEWSVHHQIGNAELWQGFVLRDMADVDADPERSAGYETRARDRFERALARFHAAEEAARRLVAADTRNRQALSALAICLNKVGRALEALGRLDEAQRRFEESLAIREQIERSDPIAEHADNVGVARYRLGGLFQTRAQDQADDPEGALRLWRRAEEHYEAAFVAFKAAAERGAGEKSTLFTREATRRMEECRREIGALMAGGSS